MNNLFSACTVIIPSTMSSPLTLSYWLQSIPVDNPNIGFTENVLIFSSSCTKGGESLAVYGSKLSPQMSSLPDGIGEPSSSSHVSGWRHYNRRPGSQQVHIETFKSLLKECGCLRRQRFLLLHPQPGGEGRSNLSLKRPFWYQVLHLCPFTICPNCTK